MIRSTVFIIGLSFILALSTAAVAGQPSAATAVNATHTATMKVDGMTCNGCVSKIKTSLGKLEGVASCEVNLEHSMATVTFDKEKINDAMLVKAIKDAGYEAKLGGLSAAGAHHHPDGCVEDKSKCPSSKKCCKTKGTSTCVEKHESKTTKAKNQKETVTDTDI